MLRFSASHEIGHVLLEHTEDKRNFEEEADYFAGYLLVPHPLIINMGSKATVINVAERFKVSIACASFAIDQAKVRLGEEEPWRPHEQWLLNNAKWKGCDYRAIA